MSVLLFYELSFLCLYKGTFITEFVSINQLLMGDDSLAYEVSVRGKTCKEVFWPVKLFTSLACIACFKFFLLIYYLTA